MNYKYKIPSLLRGEKSSEVKIQLFLRIRDKTSVLRCIFATWEDAKKEKLFKVLK